VVVLDGRSEHPGGAALILVGERERVRDFVCARIADCAVSERYEALGAVDRDGVLIGGFVFYDWRWAPGGGDIMLAAAGGGPWVTKGNLRAWFSYPFVQLGCNRITSVVSKKNRVSREMTERLGFKREGCVRGAFGPGKDGVLYGLLAQECKFTGTAVKPLPSGMGISS
jgi:RimJ/RimL family protein N-acetyltransferase